MNQEPKAAPQQDTIAKMRETALSAWSVTDLLRAKYPTSEYEVILPLALLWCLDRMLAPKRAAMLAANSNARGKGDPEELRERALREASGQLFYNTSKEDLAAVLADPDNAAASLSAYVDGFSDNVRAVMNGFRFGEQLRSLDSANLLVPVLRALADLRATPTSDGVLRVETSALFDLLLGELRLEPDGTHAEYSTPPDLQRLMVGLLLAGENDHLSSAVNVTIYDAACGSGRLLTNAFDEVRKITPAAHVKPYGQERDEKARAICNARLLLRGLDPAFVAYGDCLVDDGHPDLQADYLLCHPPFGMEWSRAHKVIRTEHEELGHAGRFGPGLPRKSDSSLLFALHLLSKMKPREAGGSRVSLVTNGSPLFSGSAGSGESEIRRWIVESDFLETIVALPEGVFTNTSIRTYVWILTNRKLPCHKGMVRIINGANYFQALHRPRARKLREVSEEDVRAIVALLTTATDHPDVLILRNEDLGYQQLVLAQEPKHSSASARGDRARKEHQRTVNIPLDLQVNAYMSQQGHLKFPNTRVAQAKVGFAVRPVAHLGFELRRELEALRAQYVGCRLEPLREVSMAIETGPRNRSWGQPRTALDVVLHAWGLKVETDEDVLLSEYLAMFFSTDVGEKLLGLLCESSVLRRIDLDDLAELEVPVPTLDKQRSLLATRANIEKVSSLLARVERELAANPSNIGVVEDTIGPVLKALGQLTAADSIREVVRGGESKRAEFKQAFSWDSRKQTKDRNLEEKSLKTIVAFLNSEGGDLLVGVSDNGEIRGVESEVKNLHKGNADKLLLHVKNRIKDTIGEQFYPFLEQRTVKIDGVTVLWIHCARSEIPVFLNEVSFYVRTTPATDKLEGYKLVEYLRVRFGLEHRK